MALAALMAILTLPIFLVLAIIVSFIEWLRQGGPAVFYSAFSVLLYWHDRYLIELLGRQLNSSFIKRVLDANEIYLAAARSIKREWAWTRFYRAYSNPVQGPYQAFLVGAFYVHAFIFIVHDVLGEHLANALFAGNFVSAPIAYLVLIRPQRTAIDWVWMVIFTGLVFQFMTQAMSYAVARNEITSFLVILQKLRAHGEEMIRLEEQTLPIGWVPPDVIDSKFARWMAQQNSRIEHGDELSDRVVADIPSMEGRQPRIFTVIPTEAGLKKGVSKLEGSYALMSPQGEQIILLHELIRPSSPWSKFNVLHEAGHLRNPGRVAYLVARNGWIFLCGALTIVELALWPMQPAQRDLIGYPFAVVWICCVYLYLRWAAWDREGQSELCADLYAFSHLSDEEIERSYPLRKSSLSAKTSSVRLHKRIVARLRLLALGRAYSSVKNKRVVWRKLAENPPYRPRTATLILSASIAVIAYAATVTWYSCMAMFVVDVVLSRQTRAGSRRLRGLRQELQTWLPEKD
ncbi:hypothetical protein A6X20_16805 [Bradyrhizobium elkanii]|nr:hypothetical protein A6X20_16805 [Bradyrhizobium elkanii]